MKVYGLDKLEAFKKRHASARGPLNTWLAEARAAQWRRWSDIKGQFPRASWLGGGRVVFDIKGNDFRLLALVRFGLGMVVIERIGTHAEYSKWNLKGGKR